MTAYDYKTVPAPRRSKRFKGVRGGAESFARTVEETLSAEAVDGWEFYRAESLPCEERKGWFGGRHEALHTVLIFRRVKDKPGFRAQPGPRHSSPSAAAAQMRTQDPLVLEEARHDKEPAPRLGPAKE
jgi:hypothetical protein